MKDTVQLRRSATEKLNLLSNEKLIEVLDFIDFLTRHPRRRRTAPDTLPPPDAFLECAGTWEFEPGELEKILRDIEQSRLMELKERHGDLFD